MGTHTLTHTHLHTHTYTLTHTHTCTHTYTHTHKHKQIPMQAIARGRREQEVDGGASAEFHVGEIAVVNGIAVLNRLFFPWPGGDGAGCRRMLASWSGWR